MDDARITRTRSGRFRLKLTAEERDILRSLPERVRDLLSDPEHPAARRLFPPAYVDDPERSAEFRRLMGEDLLQHHLGHLRVMEETVEATRLDEEQLTAWLGALNQLRLVLGTQLDVTEEMYDEPMPPDDPRAPVFALYLYLGWLEEQCVAALGKGLDPAGTDPGR